MEHVFFGDVFDEYYQVTCLTKIHVLNVVHTPDQTHVIEHGQLRVWLQTKYAPRPRPPTMVLVMTHNAVPGQITFTADLKVYEDFAPAIRKIAPLELLKLIVARFGCDVTVGGTVTRKFFFAESVPIGPGESTQILIPGCADPLGSIFATSMPNHVDCALGFAIDKPRYRDYLATKRRQ